MTYRQKFLKAVYPAWIWWTRLTGVNTQKKANVKARASVSFYSLRYKLNNGNELDFSSLQGKKILIVNTASDCGYTNQYADLERLCQQYPLKLQVLAFPANDFKEQEKGDDASIADFCKRNYGVSFPLMQKSVVIKTAAQNPVFRWLTDSTLNGWNNEPPGWNFCKYLVDEKGQLTHVWGPSVVPFAPDIIQAINQ
ncbi:MAG: glutathione peroxidase [Ferruginibacter sp.]